MKKILAHKFLLWTILAGISYVLCFPRWDMPYFSLFFLPALLHSIHHLKTGRQAILMGFLLSSMVAWGGFHWIIYTGMNFGDLSLPLAIGLLGLFCLVAAPQMIAFLYIGIKVRYGIEKLPLILRPLFWSALYVALEYLAHFLKIFPEHLGNTLIHYLPLAQSASWGGVAILSFIPLFIGSSLFYVKKEKLAALPSAITSIALLLGMWIWGQSEITHIKAQATTPVYVGLVQHNLEDLEKMILSRSSGAKQALEQTLDKLLSLSHKLVRQTPRPDFLLWPETSYPLSFPTAVPNEDQKENDKISWALYGYANLIKSFVAQEGVPLLFGGYETKNKGSFNSAILLGRNGQPLSTYRKVELLFIGEYLPFTDWFPALKNLNPQMGDFSRGPGTIPLEFPTKDLSLGVNICYEAILPTFMRQLALHGSKLFVNITKDSWFGNTFEPWQHFQLSALRSIEHRIPLVRATNTGLSGTVSMVGETHTISDPFQEAAEVVRLDILQAPITTLYTRWGDWIAYLCIIISLFSGIWAYRKHAAIR